MATTNVQTINLVDVNTIEDVVLNICNSTEFIKNLLEETNIRQRRKRVEKVIRCMLSNGMREYSPYVVRDVQIILGENLGYPSNVKIAEVKENIGCLDDDSTSLYDQETISHEIGLI